MQRYEDGKGKAILSSFVILLLLLSFVDSTSSVVQDYPVRSESAIVAEGLDLYVEEPLTCFIEPWAENTTSSGFESTANIVGEQDGLIMDIVYADTFEYAVFKINGSIMSDMMILKGCIDPSADTLLRVYSWMDAYTEPDLSRVLTMDLMQIREEWNMLYFGLSTVGDVIIEYANTSIEYILLMGTCGAPYIGNVQSINVQNLFDSFRR